MESTCGCKRPGSTLWVCDNITAPQPWVKTQKHLIWAVKDFKIMYQRERERERERERPVVPKVAISSPSTSIIVEIMEGLSPS